MTNDEWSPNLWCQTQCARNSTTNLVSGFWTMSGLGNSLLVISHWSLVNRRYDLKWCCPAKQPDHESENHESPSTTAPASVPLPSRPGSLGIGLLAAGLSVRDGADGQSRHHDRLADTRRDCRPRCGLAGAMAAKRTSTGGRAAASVARQDRPPPRPTIRFGHAVRLFPSVVTVEVMAGERFGFSVALRSVIGVERLGVSFR